jgi:hypothetical protein
LVNHDAPAARILGPSLLTAALLEAFFLKDTLTAAGPGVPNSDDFTRLAEVRDLMAGQGWFDLMQYRLGAAPGVEMHWSRLVDAPIAVLIWLGELVLPGQGEAFAGYAWPFVTMLIALAAILYGFRRVLPGTPLLPACVIGAFSLMGGGVFTPGSFDHHNIQTGLALWLIALLLPGPSGVLNHAMAGLVAAVMLAIGMETLPYAVTAAGFVTLSLIAADGAAKAARAFGLSLAASIAVLFFALVGSDNYASAACDGFSLFHLTAAGCGGLLLALLAQVCMTRRSLRFRFAGLVSIGVALGLLVILAFPHCLADPLASLDPRIRKFWLDSVIEAQSAAKIVKLDPFMLPGLFGLPIAALIVSLIAAFKREQIKVHLLFAAMLTAALLVTLWQMRGALFGLPFAAMPLAVWVSRLSAAAEDSPSPNSLKVIGAWLVSVSMFWGLLGTLGAALFSTAPTLSELAASVPAEERCYVPAQFDPLANEPDGTILGATSLGAMVLKHTGFRTLAGPYHRNSAGNLAWIESMTGTPDAARAVMRREKVTILAICPKGADEADFLADSSEGFLSRLLAGEVFPWLEPVESARGGALRFWRVKN